MHKPSYVTLIGYIMPFCGIFLYLLPDKRHPGAAEISTILHQNYFIFLGVLGVLVSYTIARGIKIVVGGSLGGFRFFGVPRGVNVGQGGSA